MAAPTAYFLTRAFRRSISVPDAFHGLGRSFVRPLRSARPGSASPSARRSFSVNASQLPRVGNPAPGFEAEAVFDKEFIKAYDV